MRHQDIVIGEKYRLKTDSRYNTVIAKKVLKPKEAENYNNFIVVKCHLLTSANDDWGLTKYFRPRDLEKIK